MIDRLERLGDCVLALIVPRASAAADYIKCMQVPCSWGPFRCATYCPGTYRSRYQRHCYAGSTICRTQLGGCC